MNVAVSPTNHVGLVAPTQDQYRISVLVAEKGAKGDTGVAGPQGPAGQNGTTYTLPTANATVLGGIKVGGNLSISNGVLSAVGGTTSLPFGNITSTPTTLGGYGITDGLTASNLVPYLLSATAASTYSVIGHTHSISNVTGLQTALDTKLATANFTYSNLTGTPSTFPPSAHSHTISDVSGLQTALDLKLPSANFTYANISGTPDLAAYVKKTQASTQTIASTASFGSDSSSLTLNSSSYAMTVNTLAGTSVLSVTPTSATLVLAGGGNWSANSILTLGYADSRYLTTSNFTYANLTGKPTFATVATTGSYTDLSNKPASYSLPTATNATLGGVIVGDNLTVTANGVLSAQAGGVTAFNNRTGNVSLTSSDVTTALTYTPLTSSTAYSNLSFTGASTSSPFNFKIQNANGSKSISMQSITAGTSDIFLSTSSTRANGQTDTYYPFIRLYTDPVYPDINEGRLLLQYNYTANASTGPYYNTSIQISRTKAEFFAQSYAWTDNSLITRSYADSRYQAAGSYLTSSDLSSYLTVANAAATYLPTSSFTYANLTGTPTLAAVATSGSYADLANLPTITNTFNGRSGNVTLTANDVTTLVNANYLQVYKDTQANESSLTQFGLSSFVQSGSLGSGYSRGLLTSNVSGTTTRSIFDGNVYQSSATARYPAYKRIAFNSNNTSGANSTGRIQVNDYGAVFIDSQTSTSGSNISRVSAFSAGSATSFQNSGDILLTSPGVNFYAYKSNNDGSNVGAEQGSFGVSEMQRGVSGPNGTYISRPYTVSFESRNTWPVADTTISYSYTPNYRTYMTIGDSAELFFQNHGNLTTRNPTWTSNSILTQGYADTRYAAFGSSGGSGAIDGGTAFGSDNTFDGGIATG